jgi:uncharacterized protein YutE (UPF0331/DUF86 family)
MPDANSEAEMLDSIASELRAEGFEVYLHPRRPPAPAFLNNYVPDAIALREDKNLVVEVVRESAQASQRLDKIRSLLEGQPKWDLRVYWVSQTKSQRAVPVATRDAIAASNNEVRSTTNAGFQEPALLLAWATFEAAARASMPNEFQRPQTPGRLVEILAREGYVTPSEADLLRSLAEKRNRLIHGDLHVSVTAEEIEKFTEVLDALIDQGVSQ